jgi:16S rRNA (guanine(966)-N(2))-methyltransferase RsmD
VRVIAGQYRGRRLIAPRGQSVRPTSDFVREALFDILHDVEGLAALDLFAGTGAIGIEALSRGARAVVLVERSRSALSVLRRNLEAIGVEDERARVMALDVGAALGALRRAGASFGLVFADPPYAVAGRALPEVLAGIGPILEAEARIVLEHGFDLEPPVAPAGLRFLRSKRYGETVLSFYETLPEGSAA